MSAYFTLDQFLRSGTASKYGGEVLKQQQNPPADVRYNIEQLSINVLDKIREKWGKPIVISSGYRCQLVNEKVGGSTNSQHCNGQAADFSAQQESDNVALMNMILDMANNKELIFDQLINEYPKANGTPDWIHISYKANGTNRNSFFTIGNKNNNIFKRGVSTGAVQSKAATPPPAGVDVTSGSQASTNVLNSTLESGTLQTPNDLDAFKYRIYQEFPPTLLVDEMSIKPNKDYGSEPESNITPKDRPFNDTEIGTLGKAYPFIRINDYNLNSDEIIEMTINHYGFVPTIELSIKTWNKAFIKTEVIKEGDICSVYCAEDHDSIKKNGVQTGPNVIRPLRCDFRITDVIYSDVNLRKLQEGLDVLIYGELNIPDLHNANMNFSFSGSSRDALRETAKQLKLGFCFNNPNNTEDVQIWQCQPTEKAGPAEFIKDVTMHSWLEAHHFFDSWIEPHYNLCFIDINQQLGWEGLDEGMDIAAIKNTLTNLQMNEGTIMSPEVDEKHNPFFAKLFHNITDNALLAHSSYRVKKYGVVNRATRVTRKIGLIRKAQQSLNNAGLYEENNIEQLEYKLAINWDKVGDPSNGKKGLFYVLDGPGSQFNYASAENINGNYAEKEISKKPEEIVDVQSTGDADIIQNSGSNEFASGNVAATYATAFDHNLLNNMQLEKQYVELICQGNNQGIMRGEKVPAFLIDHSIMEEATAGSSKNTGAQVYSHVEVIASGWFIIDGIKWHYKKNLDPTTNETDWETIVKLARREWPIPKYVGSEEQENGEKTGFNAAGGSVVESKQETLKKDDITLAKDSSISTNKETQKSSVSGTVTTDGLQQYMKDVWALLKEDQNIKDIKLISGKRWFIDANKNKLDFWDGRRVDGLYEIMNSDGTIGYYERRDSQHLYGKALDFLTTTPKENVFRAIAKNEKILDIMFANNLILQEEKYTNLNTTHFDISFNDSYAKKNAWWTFVSLERGGATSFVVNGRTVDFGINIIKKQA